MSQPAHLASTEGAFLALDTRTWAGQKGLDLFALRRAIMQQAAARGRLELLVVRGVPIAYQLSVSDRRRITSLAIGYDQNFARYGPGRLLRHEVLRRAFLDRRADVYDFMAGGSDHKAEWGSEKEAYVKLYIYRRRRRAPLDRTS